MRKRTFLAKNGFLSWLGSIFIVSFSLFASAKGFNLHGKNTFSDTPTGVIRALEVVDDTIFVGAENGLFKVIGGKSTRLALGSEEFTGIISAFYNDNNESLWISEFGIGVYRYDLVNRTIELIVSDIDTSNVWRLVATSTHLILSTVDDILIIDKATYKSLDWSGFNDGIKQAYSLSLLDDNQILVSNKDSIALINVLDKETEFFSLAHDFPLLERVSVVTVIDSHIYIGGDEGVYRVTDLKGDKEFFTFSSLNTKNRDIDSIFEDSEGNVWLAAGGLFQLKDGIITQVDWLNPLLGNDAIQSILSIRETDTGDILLASSQLGIVTLSYLHRTLDYIHRDGSLFQENIEDVYSNEQKVAYIKSNSRSYSLNLNSGELSLLSDLNHEEGSVNHCFNSTEIKFNDLLKKYNSSLDYCASPQNHLVNISSHKFYAYVHSPDSSKYYLVENQIIIDEIDAPDFVVKTILSAAGELVSYDAYDNLFIQLSNRAWKKMSNKDYGWKGITCLLESELEFLVCTSGSGLVSINKKSGDIGKSNLVEQEQLRFIRAGVISQNHLWLATNRGLYIFSLDGQLRKRLDHSDGIFDVDFEYSGIHSLGTKLLIMGDRYNYLIDEASAISAIERIEKRSPRVSFFELSTVDDDGKVRSVPSGENRIEIASDIFTLNATVSSSDFLKQHEHKVQFKVQNYIDGWQTLDKSYGNISLSDLDYGEYHLSLRILNSMTGEVFDRNTLLINVVTPFYLSWGAYMVYGLLLLALVWKTQKIRSLITAKLLTEVSILRRFRKGELESNQDRIESLMQDKARVFTDLSHELRTPLHLISGVIKKVDSNQPVIGSDTKNILLRNVQRLESLTEQMVKLEKIDIAGLNNQKIYDVDNELKLQIASMEPLAKAKKQTFQVRFASKARMRLIDGSLEHIISNLVTNAVKYSPDYSTIKVNTSSNEKEVKITVADNGIGIDPTHHQDIFKRFTRVEENCDNYGQGIGLAFVKELVTVNRGTISLDSALGQGAKFSIRFTRENDEPVSERIETNVTKKNAVPTILVVEDNLDLRGYLFDLFNPEYQCLTAKTGAHALDVLEHYTPDLVITDYYMPDMDGVSFIQELRTRKEHVHTPAILLTATNIKGSAQQVFEAKIDCILQKPISDDELKSRVQHLLSIRDHVKTLRHELSSTENRPSSYLNIPNFNNEKDLNFYLKFIAVLEKNYKDETFNRAQAADQMLISVRQLNRRLSDLFEYNFTEFLSRFRIDKAVKALEKGGAIMDLSLDVGFGTPTYFSTTFKRVTGLPPKKFQEAFFGTQSSQKKA